MRCVCVHCLPDASITGTVTRAKVSVLIPLQAALVRAAGAENTLSPELQKELRLQPLLMKGHLLELDQALDQFRFDAYVSKTTGATYPGGKVEREVSD